MKKLILSVIFLACGTVANANCGSEVLTWPSDVISNCAEQHWETPAASVGATRLVIDAVHIGSDAVFRCGPNGWFFVGGSCNAPHNFDCIKAELAAKLSVDQIKEILDDPDKDGHKELVEVTNRCDLK